MENTGEKKNPIQNSKNIFESSTGGKDINIINEMLELPAEDDVFESKGVMYLKKNLFADVQANILEPTRQKYTLFCFLTFLGQYRSKIIEWWEKMPITSAEGQKAGGDTISALISFQGYEFFLDENRINNLIPINADEDIIAFQQGLTKRCPRAFGGKKTNYREATYKKNVHALILIATNDEQLKNLNEEPNRIRQHEGLRNIFNVATDYSFEEEFFENVFFEIGLRNPEGSGGPSSEWFGFRDGISNPRFFTPQNLKKRQEAPSTLDTVLRPDRLSSENYGCGSFVVFLKLEQDQKAFEDVVEELEKKLNFENGTSPVKKEDIEAHIIGRYKNGRPLSRLPLNSTKDVESFNEFDFIDDKKGEYCPLHAHIRKANPRDGKDVKRIVRRGKIYGHRDSDKKGILFLSYQSSLRTFEDVINRGLYSYNYQNKNTGQDLLFSEKGVIRSHKYPNSFGKMMNPYPFIRKNLVTFRGGYYFFAPPISFIRENLKNFAKKDNG